MMHCINRIITVYYLIGTFSIAEHKQGRKRQNCIIYYLKRGLTW